MSCICCCQFKEGKEEQKDQVVHMQNCLMRCVYKLRNKKTLCFELWHMQHHTFVTCASSIGFLQENSNMLGDFPQHKLLRLQFTQNLIFSIGGYFIWIWSYIVWKDRGLTNGEMGEQKKTGERRSDRYELKRKTGERDRERAWLYILWLNN